LAWSTDIISLTYAETVIEPTKVDISVYFETKVIPRKDWANDPTLIRATQRAIGAGIEDRTSALEGQLLAILAKGMKAERILEIGTRFG
jgi:predicted O-methyltransferase YrrM